MSFFRFEPHDRLKQRFLEVKGEQEDLAVYTWGEDSYDGLGDALQEGGDELNDETFGGTGEVGKFSMFHWIGTAFPIVGRQGLRFHTADTAARSPSGSCSVPIGHLRAVTCTARPIACLWSAGLIFVYGRHN